MGLLISEVTFEGGVPDLALIANKVAELSGLPVSVSQRLAEDDQLHAMLADLAFVASPNNCVEVSAYRPGAVRNWVDEDGHEMVIRQARGRDQGYDEPPGRQTVYVQGYLEQEPTLWLFILRTLQELGGKMEHPLSEKSLALCNKPVALAELERRGQKCARNVRIGHIVYALFLPFSVLLMLSSILLLPFKLTRRRINQAVELAHEASRESGKPDYVGRLKYAFMMLWALGAVALILCTPLYLVYRAVAYAYGCLAGHGGT